MVNKRMLPAHYRQMRKDNSKQLPAKSVSAVVDSPDNPTLPRDKVFKIINAPTLEEYPSLIGERKTENRVLSVFVCTH